MNKSKFKKVLMHYSIGKSITEISFLLDIPKKEILEEFEANQILDMASATKKLNQIEDEEFLARKNENTNKGKLAGQEAPQFKPQKSEYAGTFNKTRKEIQNLTEEVPLELQQEFRRDFRERAWKDFSAKWKDKLNLDEKDLKEQVKRVSPSLYRERF